MNLQHILIPSHNFQIQNRLEMDINLATTSAAITSPNLVTDEFHPLTVNGPTAAKKKVRRRRRIVIPRFLQSVDLNVNQDACSSNHESNRFQEMALNQSLVTDGKMIQVGQKRKSTAPRFENNDDLNAKQNSLDASPLNHVINGFQQLTLNQSLVTDEKNVQKKNEVSQLIKNSNLDVTNFLSDDEVETNEFEIRAVSCQNRGQVFRIKNLGCRHIHKSFYSSFNNKISRGHQSTSKISNELSNTINYIPAIPNCNGIIRSNAIAHLDKSPLQSNTNVASAGTSSKKKYKSKKNKVFPLYWNFDEVANGLTSGLVTGFIRINQRNHNESYVTDSNQSVQDYFISTVVDRNRALEGDLVAIKIKPQEEWTETQRTAYVVYILEEVHPRTAVGHLLPLSEKKMHAIFVPRDKRIPRIKIPMDSCPKAFNVRKTSSDVLYKAKITSWSEVDFAQGMITDLLGISGDLNSEITSILAENDVNVEKIPQEYNTFFKHPDNIPSHEYTSRLDFRKVCVFTIDPLTACDLDDAVSCRELLNGNVEVAVHISDVAFHLTEDTPLDKAVCKRATSVYLVNKVYHMLPEELCNKCSLLPGIEKRAFSVIWEMKHNGEIVKQSFGRSVINSCTQLAYEHAQIMIEDPDHVFEENELPQIYGGFTPKDLSRIVNTLNGIAVNLRQKRFAGGALRIDQTKLSFKLDEETGEPSEFFAYENKDAHRLIEEFMLLANISVAHKIVKAFPKLAFLRCHDPPKKSMLIELQKNLSTLGLDIDISSSLSLQSSIWNLTEKLGVPQIDAVNHLLAKPMTRARYFCAATEGNFNHYALHVPIYTHFTSPIRRYADIVVHRLLAASLGYRAKPTWNVDTVAAIANNCNRQKQNAKLAGNASSDLFLARYVENHQPFVKTAVVFRVRNHSFDILVNATGSIIRIHEKSFEKDLWKFQEIDNHNKIYIIFPETVEDPEEVVKIEMFETITVNLTRKSNTNALEAHLLRPISTKFFKSTGALQT